MVLPDGKSYVGIGSDPLMMIKSEKYQENIFFTKILLTKLYGVVENDTTK